MMSEQKIESLVKELTCEDIIRCQKARRALVNIGHEAVPSLVKALENKHEWVRWEAAKALGQIADPAATEALVKALEDRSFDVRWLAAEGLVAIGKKAVAPLLRALMYHPKSIWLREGAHHFLSDMDRSDWEGILEPVISALDGLEPSVVVPHAARRALDEIEKHPAHSVTD